MKRTTLFLVFLVLISACGSTQQVSESIPDTTPEWVKNHPISSDHYIGIGIANKASHPTDYMQIAQQNALQNLASQIKVSIASQSVFLQMEREYQFEEEFKSNIKIKAQEQLEGYELVGNHIQGNEYWVYYRLNKYKQQEVRQARMQESMEQAKALLDKTAWQYPLKTRYIHFLQALEILKPYLSEPLETQYDGKKVFLASETLARFRKFINQFRVLSLNKKIKVMVGNKLGDLRFSVTFKEEPQEGIPLIIASDIIDLKPFNKATDSEGIFIAIAPKITATDPIQKVEVGIDFNPWMKEATQDAFIHKVIRNIKSHNITIPVYVYTPMIYVLSEEEHLGEKSKHKTLKHAAEGALSGFGFTPTADKSDAQLIMQLDAFTKKGRQEPNQKMFTAFLHLNIQVKDQSGMIVYNEQIQKLKGIQLSFEQASSKAYQNASLALKEEIIPEFIQSFIHQ